MIKVAYSASWPAGGPLKDTVVELGCVCGGRVSRRLSPARPSPPPGWTAASWACRWSWAGRGLCHVSTSSPCATSPPTNSGSPPGPPAARSPCGAPAPLEDTAERRVKSNTHTHARARQKPDCLTSTLTWWLVCGRSGPGHGGQAVRRLALRPLLLLLLRASPSLQADGHRGLAVGAGETREEDAADAFADARRSCDEYGEGQRVRVMNDEYESSNLYSIGLGWADVMEFKEK